MARLISQPIDPAARLGIDIFRIRKVLPVVLRLMMKMFLNLGALSTLVLTNVLLRHPILDDNNENTAWLSVYIALFSICFVGSFIIIGRLFYVRRWGWAIVNLAILDMNMFLFAFLCCATETCLGVI